MILILILLDDFIFIYFITCHFPASASLTLFLSDSFFRSLTHSLTYSLALSGDDLAKSPHMGRIASSVYDDVCEKNDPLCYNFRYHPDHGPTPSMAASVLYKMHSAGRKPGVSVDPTLFKEVYSSKYGLVRIYQILNVSLKSKAWLADPANRVCDRPGSWYCVGQYPPSIQKPPSSHRHISYEHGD